MCSYKIHNIVRYLVCTNEMDRIMASKKNTHLYHTAKQIILQYSAVHFSAVHYYIYTVNYYQVQYSAEQYGTVKYTIQYSTIQFRTFLRFLPAELQVRSRWLLTLCDETK